MAIEGYDVAQICLNGHVVTASYNSYPQHRSPHCDQCGAGTITVCPKCSTAIRGYYRVPGVVGFHDFHAPAYCSQCGAPYPWTEARLNAARELVRELDRLDPNEKGILNRSLDDLVRDTPNTAVSALRFKQLVAKAGPFAMEGLKTILYDVLAEGAKRLIWPK